MSRMSEIRDVSVSVKILGCSPSNVQLSLTVLTNLSVWSELLDDLNPRIALPATPVYIL